eukprot:g910.t1
MVVKEIAICVGTVLTLLARKTLTSSRRKTPSDRAKGLRRRWRRDLVENVIPFWLTHSPDKQCGGYFTCLDRDGTVLSKAKYHWLQGRAVWTFARLYLRASAIGIDDDVERERLFQAACNGARFLERAKRADGRFVFGTSRDGSKVLKHQRTPYTAVFYCLANLEFYRLLKAREMRTFEGTTLDTFLHRARRAFTYVCASMRDPSVCGGQPIAANETTSSVSVLGEVMCLACLAEELSYEGEDTSTTIVDYGTFMREAMESAVLHFDVEHNVFVELVEDRALGVRRDTAASRLVNPGHSIEVSWFLLRLCERVGSDGDLTARVRDVALRALEGALELGWDDARGGGILYMLDIMGLPMQDMTVTKDHKLWWPLCEALYATAFAFRTTKDLKWLRWLERVDDYIYAHLCDAAPEGGGGWFGYLTPNGKVFNRAKGGNYKGFFHVPRALLFSVECFDAMDAE